MRTRPVQMLKKGRKKASCWWLLREVVGNNVSPLGILWEPDGNPRENDEKILNGFSTHMVP